MGGGERGGGGEVGEYFQTFTNTSCAFLRHMKSFFEECEY